MGWWTRPDAAQGPCAGQSRNPVWPRDHSPKGANVRPPVPHSVAGSWGRPVLLVQHVSGDAFPGNVTRTCDPELYSKCGGNPFFGQSFFKAYEAGQYMCRLVKELQTAHPFLHPSAALSCVGTGQDRRLRADGHGH